VKDYIANYGRPFIFTTALAHPNVILANCTFDLLEDGTTTILARRVLGLAQYLVKSLQPYLGSIPSHVLSLPSHFEHSTNASASNAPPTATPILPILTSHPRPLASFLLARGIDARPITWPTVPKGAERVRICIHAGNTQEEVDSLITGCVEWATTFMRNQGEDEQPPQLGGTKEQIGEVVSYAKARL
jgi:8-amino-7-oxononanoate synthase